jgi:hypothetical protein
LPVCIRFDRIGELQQQTPALGARHVAPLRERRFRRSDGTIDVGVIRHRDFGDHRVVVRIERGECFARERWHEAAVDEELRLHVSPAR